VAPVDDTVTIVTPLTLDSMLPFMDGITTVLLPFLMLVVSVDIPVSKLPLPKRYVPVTLPVADSPATIKLL